MKLDYFKFKMCYSRVLTFIIEFRLLSVGALVNSLEDGFDDLVLEDIFKRQEFLIEK